MKSIISFRKFTSSYSSSYSKNTLIQTIKNTNININLTFKSSLFKYITSNLEAKEKSSINILDSEILSTFSHGLKYFIEKESVIINLNEKKTFYKDLLLKEEGNEKKYFSNMKVFYLDLNSIFTYKMLEEYLNLFLEREIFDLSLIYESISEYDKLILKGNIMEKLKISKNINDYLLIINYLSSLYYKNHMTPIVIIDNYSSFLLRKNEDKENHIHFEDYIKFLNEFINKCFTDNQFISKVILNGVQLYSPVKIFRDVKDIHINHMKYKLHVDNFHKIDHGSNAKSKEKEIEEIDSILNLNEVTYIDTIKTLVHFKKQAKNEVPLEKGVKFKSFDLNFLIKNGVSLENSFENYIINKIHDGFIVINHDNTLSITDSAKDIYNNILNSESIFSLPYKQQLACIYYDNINDSQFDIQNFLKKLKNLLIFIGENSKKTKNYEKFPNFQFRNEKEIEDYLIDVFTLDLNSSIDNKETINIYEVDDEEIGLSEEIKKFTLITFDSYRIGVFIKGNKYKKEVKSLVFEEEEGENETNFKMTKTKKGFSLQKEKESSQVDVLSGLMTKANENFVCSIKKQEALNFARRANKNIDTVYIVSAINYMKAFEFSVLMCKGVDE